MIRRPSIRLSHRSTAATAVGGFADERHAGRRHRSAAAGAGAQQQMQVKSRSEPTEDSSQITITLIAEHCKCSFEPCWPCSSIALPLAALKCDLL